MIKRKQLNQTLFWKLLVIGFGLISLSSGLVKGSDFWTGYVFDIAGPAWCYILIRAQYKSKNARFLTVKFSPEFAFFLVIGICFIIESMQYLNIYNSTFDSFDFLAYFSGTFLVYLLDKWLGRMR